MLRLRALGGLWLVFVGWLAVVPVKAAAAETLSPVTLKMLDQLAQQYREEGLPLPPPDAPLMLVFAGSWNQNADGKTTPLYFLSYRLKAGETKARPGTFLVGTELHEPELTAEEAEKPLRIVNPDQPLPSHLQKDWWDGPSFPVNTWLAIAIQSYLRGYHGLVRQILERGLTQDRRNGGPTAVSSGRGWVDPRVNRSMAEPTKNSNLSESLAATAWNHWMNVVQQPGTDDKEVLARMEKLLVSHPALDGPAQRAFLASLRLKLQPSQSKPGSVDALIDGLTEFSVAGGRMTNADPTSDPNYAKLQRLGFAAVPTLLEHLDDQRLTRSVTVGFNNFRTLPRRVGEVVSDLIEGLAEPELGQDWLSRQLGNVADNEPVRRWWEKAKAMGEEAYVTSHVFPVAKGKNDAVNLACLRIVADRYPQHLGEVYVRLLQERPDLGSSQVAEAIAASEGLSQEEKRHLLQRGAEHPALARREDALFELFKLDAKDAEGRLMAELDRLPSDAEEAYWRCPEARLANLVMKTSSPAVWEAFARAAKRATVGLRLELMNPLNYSYVGDGLRTQRLACLAQFLDDQTIRIARGGKYAGPGAAFTFPEISVRDFAAKQIGSILGVAGHPDKGWSSARWAEYRVTVGAGLTKP